MTFKLLLSAITLFICIKAFAEDARFDFIATFPAPPEVGSEIEQNDYLALAEFQLTRTEEDCARAEFEAKSSFSAFFGPAFGPLSSEEIEFATDIFKKVYHETGDIVDIIKSTHRRPRPFQKDPTVLVCVRPHSSVTNSSYPSGHSAIAESTALALGEVFPQHREALIERADVIARDRALAGVHYLSDTIAGKNLGTLVFETLMKDPAFVNTLHEARESE